MRSFSPYRNTTQYQTVTFTNPVYQSTQSLAHLDKIPVVQETSRSNEELKKLRQQNKYLQQYQQMQQESDNQVMQIEKRFQILMNENKTLNSMLVERDQEMDRLKSQNIEMNIDINRLKGQDLEVKLARDMIELRMKENEKLRTKHNQLESKISQVQQQLSDANNRITVLLQEVQQWKTRFTELDQERLRQLEQTRFTLETMKQQDLDSLRMNYDEQIKQLEQNMDIISSEYDKVVSMVKQKNDELDTWKIKFSKLEVKASNDLKKLDDQFKKINNDKDNLQKYVDSQVEDQNEKNREVEILTKEIQRLKEIISSRDEDIDKFRSLLEQTAQQIPLFQEKNKQYILFHLYIESYRKKIKGLKENKINSLKSLKI